MKSTATHPLTASFIGTMLEFCLRLGLEIQRLCFRIGLPNQRPAATALRKPPMHPETADQALRYFLTVARLAGARVFLISGTLLGFYRSGRLLGHDKDIDLGVMWDDPALPALLAALRSSDHLRLYATVRVCLLAALMNPQLPSLPNGTLSFKYDYFSGNGKRVRIDLFVHFPMGSEIVHGSCRTLWGNSPFTLSERLAVGVSTDSFNTRKGKEAYLSFEERCESLLSCRYVDEIFPETHWNQKLGDVRRLGARTFVMGSDWIGRFDFLKELCEVVYLPRTPLISSTLLRSALAPTLRAVTP